jgi:hypothetical protein
MPLSTDAVKALLELEHGARFNCIHSIARELIDEGYAFDGWGMLEITEMGRRAARTFRSFTAVGSEIANIGDALEPKFETPLNSHQVPDPDSAFDALPQISLEQGFARRTGFATPIADRSANKNDLILPGDQVENTPVLSNHDDHAPFTAEPRPEQGAEQKTQGEAPENIPWSRARAMKAAGVANGAQEVWVGASWVRAFMDAYEQL